MAAPKFYPLTVSAVRKTIRDAVEVTLLPDDGDAFAFVPGQYLTFRQAIDGVEIRRSYSICSGPDDGCLQVGIKRVDGGAFSTWANEELRSRDRVEAMTPMGAFHSGPAPAGGAHYLGFAGGSGITPVLSILRGVLAREPESRFTLVYANKAVNTVMFREELEDLKNLHMGRFSVVHVLETDAQEIELFTGMVTEDRCAELFARWIDISSVDLALICGPEPMMLGIAAALRSHGLRDDHIRFELFSAAQPGRLAKRATSRNADAVGAVQVEVTLDGARRRFEMDRDQTVLEAVRAQDIDAPFACKAGVCSTCRCRLLDGEVEMMANHALEDYEVAQGFILSCQSLPVSDRIEIDYDH